MKETCLESVLSWFSRRNSPAEPSPLASSLPFLPPPHSLMSPHACNGFSVFAHARASPPPPVCTAAKAAFKGLRLVSPTKSKPTFCGSPFLEGPLRPASGLMINFVPCQDQIRLGFASRFPSSWGSRERGSRWDDGEGLLCALPPAFCAPSAHLSRAITITESLCVSGWRFCSK